MYKCAVILAACAAALGAGLQHAAASSIHSERPPVELEASGSETLAVVSQSGWRPITPDGRLTATSLTATSLTRTPSYAAPLSAGDFRPDEAGAAARDGKDDRRGRDAQRAQGAQRDGATTRAPRHQRDGGPRDAADGPTTVPLPLPPPPPPPVRPTPWGAGPRVTPIIEPDGDVDTFGYRYAPGLGPGFGPGPSATTPFWEAAWLRRRERLLQELGLGQQGLCRCVAAGDACGFAGPAGYPGYSAIGFLPRYRYDDQDLPYRLGVGAYGLYGSGRPLHHHNSALLGAARLHDNPN